MTEGVRGSEGNTRDGRTKSGSETVDEQIEKLGEKRILPCAMPESTQDRATKTDLGQGTTEEIGEEVPDDP